MRFMGRPRRKGRRATRCLKRLGGATLVVGIVLSLMMSASAGAATGANFVATGHDMDFHCSFGSTPECEYFKIVVEQVRNGSKLPVLALDQGSTEIAFPGGELPAALADIGLTGAEVVTVNPAETAAFNATAFVNAKGEPLYSAIITASDETCGGCDNNEAGESNINARAGDFETFFNGGGGILALAGADRFSTYYNFVPLKVGATAVAPPFEVTALGLSLGITNEQANCCATHNSFNFPPPEPLVTLEKDTAGQAETIAVFNGTIEKGKFGSSLKTTLSGGGQTGAEITVSPNTPVEDQATLSGENVAEATGTVDYRVYSDAGCTTLVKDAGTVAVTGGTVPPSSKEPLAEGTYYWQASYSGDEHNKASQSACGSEVEKVEAEVAKGCTTAKGVGHLGKIGKEGLNEDNNVNVAGKPHQFEISEPGLHVRLVTLVNASCKAITGGSEFSGEGNAIENKHKGYHETFAFSVTEGNVYLTAVVEKEGIVILNIVHQKLNKKSKEHIS